MPVIDDAPAASAHPTGRGSRSSQPAPRAEGTGHGEGTAADGIEAAAGSGEPDTSNENPAMTLARLRNEAQQMKAARKELQKNLKNARKRNQRLKLKAKKLSDQELLQIVAMRNGIAMVTNPSSSSTSAASSSRSGPGVSAPPVATAAGSDVAADGSDDDGGMANGSGSNTPRDMQRLADRMEL